MKSVLLGSWHIGVRPQSVSCLATLASVRRLLLEIRIHERASLYACLELRSVTDMIPEVSMKLLGCWLCSISSRSIPPQGLNWLKYALSVLGGQATAPKDTDRVNGPTAQNGKPDQGKSTGNDLTPPILYCSLRRARVMSCRFSCIWRPNMESGLPGALRPSQLLYATH